MHQRNHAQAGEQVRRRAVALVVLVALAAATLGGTVPASASPTVPMVAAGYAHTLAVKGDGTLWSWGGNSYGCLGQGSTAMDNVTPTQVGSDADWETVAAGQFHTLAIKQDGSLWAWGNNYSGELGDGTSGSTAYKRSPVRIGLANDWAAVSGGSNFSLAIKTDGTLWSWGYNNNGQLGLGSTTPTSTPAQVGTDSDWAQVSAGGSHGIARKTDGTLWAWGLNNNGQLGDGTISDSAAKRVPVRIGTDSDWAWVVGGAFHSHAIKRDGTLYGWGFAGPAGSSGINRGQLGIGNTTGYRSPTRVGTDSDWKTVAAGYYHTVATKTNGELWSWGAAYADNQGELGIGTRTGSLVPVRVGDQTGWTQVSAGRGVHAIALRSDGISWAWGHNMSGQCGIGVKASPQVSPVHPFAPGDLVDSTLSVESSTHPVPAVAGPGDFAASVEASDTESWVRGISWTIDRSAETTPDAVFESVGTTASIQATGLAPGLWYLHVTSADGGFNWSGPVHLAFTVNSPPVASDDAFTVAEDSVLATGAPGVLGNDTDPDGDPMRAVLATDVAHGTLSLAEDGGFTYTPQPDWHGTDTFTYRASDATLTSEPATVTIQVTPVNDAPQAADDTYTMFEDSVLATGAPGVLGNDTDVDGDTLTGMRVTGPAHGVLALAEDGGFTYTPHPNWHGTDTFTYRAADGSGGTDTGSVTIVVADMPEPFRGVVRVAGPNRYATNVAASVAAFPDGANAVVVATGENWPDALGGSALAGAVEGPLLLTARASLPAGARAEIGRLGATKAYVLGGTAAVSAGVEAELKGILGAGNVVRLSGTNRYGTAQAVADEVIRLLGPGYDGTAFVATGANFPDALASSPIAAAEGWPILLANPASGAAYLPPRTTDAVVLGGTSAVPVGVESALKGRLGAGNVTRVGGANRYATARLVAESGAAAGLGWNGVGVATGQNFPDALSAGAMLGELDTVLLLTQSSVLNGEAAGALAAHRADISVVHVIGGTAAVTSGVETQIRAAAGL